MPVGLAFASAMTSPSVLYFEFADVMNRNGELATSATGVKSFSGSRGMLFWIAGAMIMLSACPITMS